LAAVVPAAWTRLGWSNQVDGKKMRFFGHSLGAAVALIAASEYHIQKGVIISPFTSTMDMAKIVIGLPIGPLVTQRYDNSARLRELESFGDTRVMIIHGVEDEVIPVEMGRQLKTEHPNMVQLVEIPGGHHNDLSMIATDQIIVSMRVVTE
jgi:pimeloyl-ACP methyl ester carboxylesterase